MELTKVQKEEMNKKLHEIFESTELEEAFKETYKDEYNSMAKELLTQEGFPENVDVNKGNFNVKISVKSEVEVFTEIVQNNGYVEDQEQFNDAINNRDLLIQAILDNLQETNMKFEIKESPEEYLNLYPTQRYLSEMIEKNIDIDRLEMYLRQSDDFKEMIKESAVEEGHSYDVDIDKLQYRVDNLRLKESSDTLANMYLSSGRFEGNNSVSDLVSNDIYHDIVNNRLYEAKVSILTDVQEMNE
ncbi:TPA: hypothetical protein ACK1AU_002623 [Staphylococcus aureus]|uniref:hypothetical protein n=1 Tax=Staphylococcus TaxID=1279 RepID=UPI000D03652A|nr:MULTISPECIES: hypothetical protein [Staphylococcus]MDT0694143.1 hypothetical protein [Staphylococcus chromogenes]HDK8139689.1 hypothetical protein [Staphylococcus aureus]